MITIIRPGPSYIFGNDFYFIYSTNFNSSGNNFDIYNAVVEIEIRNRKEKEINPVYFSYYV